MYTTYPAPTSTAMATIVIEMIAPADEELDPEQPTASAEARADVDAPTDGRGLALRRAFALDDADARALALDVGVEDARAPVTVTLPCMFVWIEQ